MLFTRLLAEMSSTAVTPELVALDLFAGIGGISLGLHAVGVRTAVANDLDPFAIETIRHNFPDIEAVEGSIEDPKVFRQVLQAAKQAGVNLVVGGPPCQGFSQVGNHRDLENDPRNSLYKRFVQMVKEVRPLAFIMENVPGLAQRSKGKVLEQVERSLSLGGEYRVVAGVLDAADFGVPQSRQRIIFLGLHDSLDKDPVLPEPRIRLSELLTLARVPGPNGFRYEVRRRESRQLDLLTRADALEMLADPNDVTLVTTEQAISDLEHLTSSPRIRPRKGDTVARYQASARSAYQRIMRKGWGRKPLLNGDVPFMWEDTVTRLNAVPIGGNYRDIPEELQARYLNGQKWGPETGKSKLSRKYFFAYRRLHPGFVSWTLNTKADCVYHYDGTRALSVREFARLSSFPDKFEVRGRDKHSRYRLVGNAVPPFLAVGVGRQLVRLLSARTKKAG